jgi:membrane-bound metal-dependent hydrolase YbcI (DUF457 family)
VRLSGALVANAIPDKDRHAAKGEKRSGTHWLITGALLTWPVWLLAGQLAGDGFLVGYWLHLLADACTPEGCPLLGPVIPQPFRILPFRIRFVSGRPPAGWIGCPYIPVPEPFAVLIVLAVDLLVLRPAIM